MVFLVVSLCLVCLSFLDGRLCFASFLLYGCSIPVFYAVSIELRLVPHVFLLWCLAVSQIIGLTHCFSHFLFSVNYAFSNKITTKSKIDCYGNIHFTFRVKFPITGILVTSAQKIAVFICYLSTYYLFPSFFFWFFSFPSTNFPTEWSSSVCW